jgi:hypothetical protein
MVKIELEVSEEAAKYLNEAFQEKWTGWTPKEILNSALDREIKAEHGKEYTLKSFIEEIEKDLGEIKIKGGEK